MNPQVLIVIFLCWCRSVMLLPLDNENQLESINVTSDSGAEILVNKHKDCGDLYLEGYKTSGLFKVWPFWSRDRKGFYVYCDMETDGGGWTVIHRWIHPEVPERFFHRSWSDYKDGFGDLESAFWLGNEEVHELTSQGVYELRFDFENNNDTKYSTYESFFIESEDVYYKLHLGYYQLNGTGGDVFGGNDKANFSTHDQNSVPWTEDTGTYGRGTPYRYNPVCLESDIGWWFDINCSFDPQIHPTSRSQTSIKTEMKIRRISFSQKKATPP